MVYIEFFDDKELLDNLCSCFVRVPDKVYFLGNNKDKMDEHIERYKSILSDRGVHVEMTAIPVNRTSTSALVERMSEIVEKEEDCIFDLTGGDDLCLVAMGIVFERYRHTKNIQMHRFNLRSNRIYDCDEDGEYIYEENQPEISVEENIRIFGGEIIYDDVVENGTHIWDMNDDFVDDIEVMWHISSTNSPDTPSRFWDRQIMIFEKIESIGSTADPLTARASFSELRRFFEANGKVKNKSYYINRKIISELERYRLISFRENGDEITITYKNEQVKRCLTKAGQILEMKTFMLALFAEKDGKPVYNDVMSGVSIDWDGDEDCDAEIRNEIDVIAMHGMIPVFISCKNGEVKSDELYKLYSVAAKFGGKYSQKVLVASDLRNSKNEEIIRERADEMGIEIIDAMELSGAKFEKRIGNVWAG